MFIFVFVFIILLHEKRKKMIEKALDIYNRVRPENAPMMTMKDLSSRVLVKQGKAPSNSAITSMSQSFRRLDRNQQDSIRIPVLIAISDILNIDINTLVGFYDDSGT